MMIKGSLVVAAIRFTEDDFDVPGEHVHAEPGQEGEIVDVFDDGQMMVRWTDSGTACAAWADELIVSITPQLQRETISA